MSISLILASELAKRPSGVVLDIGAGAGVLLNRLATLQGFRSSAWEYRAVEEESRHSDIIQCAAGHRIHKRVDVQDLESFYREWPLGADQHAIVVVRNVLHELMIDDTAKLLAALARNVPREGCLVIQDLSVFPVAEKGNVCWDPGLLQQVIASCGFDMVTTAEQTRSGNGWFNIIGHRHGEASLSDERVLELVIAQRHAQWRGLREIGALSSVEPPGREERVAKIDLDLQFAALTHQLDDVGAEVTQLTRKANQLIAREVLEAVLERATFSPSEVAEIGAVHYFKDRANSQGSLQAFLESPNAVTCISGPPYMGKSALVRHVLSTFRHRRSVVQLDMLHSTSVWLFVEALLTELGTRVPPQVVGRLKHMEFAQMQEPLLRVLVRCGERLVVVLDHVERLLTPGKTLADPEIGRLLAMMAGVPGIKIILTSRVELAASLIPDIKISQDHPVVGRFPRGGHVENLLGHFIGRTEYPEDLLEAIDRHPFMAFLAGRILEREDRDPDEELLRLLRSRLRNELMSRIATDGSRDALQWISFARGPVPRLALEEVAGRVSVKEALETGLVYVLAEAVGGERIACVGALRLETATRTSSDGNRVDGSLRYHQAWALAFRRAYASDDDPRWIREAHYHTAVSGNPTELARFGRQYRSEIRDAGEYWFRNEKKFADALWAFEQVRQFSEEIDPHVEMRIASCMIRTGRHEDGLSKFHDLFAAYPVWIGARRSYVDGLLYLERYVEALAFLEGVVPFEGCNDEWIIAQYGRTYLGLYRYREAVDAFTKRLGISDDEFSYRMLAQAYRNLGRRLDEQRTLNRGLARFPDSNRLTAARASWLETNGHADQAVELLRPLVVEDPLDAWLGFAFVQALIRVNGEGEARQYYEEHGRHAHPSFLRDPILAWVLRGEGRYREAVACLQQSDGQANRDRAHLSGQLCEIYVEWASASGAKGEAIAKAAIDELALERHNLRLNISVAKLCILADDREQFDVMIQACRSINPESTDLRLLLEGARERWGDASIATGTTRGASPA